MHRRTVLTSVGTAVIGAVAGCAAIFTQFSAPVGTPSTASLRMTPLDAVELSSWIVPTIRSRQLTGYTSRDLVQFLRDSSVVESVRPPFADGAHYFHKDAIYELSYAKLE
ncbi:hypothetical protein [Halocatena halophila]|uniref:hypothetical protein n=1 Tax=Halocatena halophila TaxID=2814576 RepID=UPI002ED2E57B